MSDANFKIQITADATHATAEAKKTSTALQDVGKQGVEADKAITAETAMSFCG